MPRFLSENLYKTSSNRPYWKYFSMDGVFMKEIIKWTALLLFFVVLVTIMDVMSDRQKLRDSLIRLHVVGASDEEADQAVKLKVRDAVTVWLQQEMSGIHQAEQARTYLREHLAQIEEIANRTLSDAGFSDKARVSFLEETFPVREYDTFTLPSGVYHSLRIRIGEAEGKNWWCVVFPSLCMGSTVAEMENTAVSAGFDKTLTETLTGEKQYELRFFLLDCLGMLENFFHSA